MAKAYLEGLEEGVQISFPQVLDRRGLEGVELLLLFVSLLLQLLHLWSRRKNNRHTHLAWAIARVPKESAYPLHRQVPDGHAQQVVVARLSLLDRFRIAFLVIVVFGIALLGLAAGRLFLLLLGVILELIEAHVLQLLEEIDLLTIVDHDLLLDNAENETDLVVEL